jgi:hypothetical protein
MGERAAECALQIEQGWWTFVRRDHDDFRFRPVLVGVEANGKNRHLGRSDGAQRGGLRIRHLAHKCQREVVILARYTASVIAEFECCGGGCDQAPRLAIGKGGEEQAHRAARS